MHPMTSISPHTRPPFSANDRLRTKEAASIARVSVGMIYRWMGEGRFKTWVVTRRGFTRGVRYIDKASFEHFLQSQREHIA
jgi:transposase